jgi:ribosomal protein L20
MPRVKRGVTAHARHKKILALAKGFRGRRKNVFRIAKQAVMKAGQYAYRDRRTRKRGSVSSGSRVSTPRAASSASPTASSWPA